MEISWENYGKLWKTTENYGKLWKLYKIMENYGKLWKTMENYGKLWKTWKTGVLSQSKCEQILREMERYPPVA